MGQAVNTLLSDLFSFEEFRSGEGGIREVLRDEGGADDFTRGIVNGRYPEERPNGAAVARLMRRLKGEEALPVLNSVKVLHHLRSFIARGKESDGASFHFLRGVAVNPLRAFVPA